MAVYSDIDFKFERIQRNDLVKLTDTDAINQSIKNIILTIPGEVPFEPLFGSNVKRLLFEQMTPATTLILKNEIRMALKNFEPRIKINTIDIDPLYDNNQYSINIYYTVLKLQIEGEIELTLNLQGI
jgi:hypothetical protein